MGQPWFQRHGTFNFRPLQWQGRALQTVTYAVMALSVGFGFFFTEPESAAWWLSGAIGLLSFFVGHAIILWKMDWRFGRR